MSNLRIVYDNAISRALPPTASSAVTGFPASNLQADKKSSVWRATGTTVRLTAIWLGAETLSAVALPFCNLSPTATMRVRITNEAIATNQFTYSDQFDNAAWIKSRATITSTTAPAPDGSLTAEVVKGDGTGSSYAYQPKTLAANVPQNISIFVKAGTYAGVFSITDFTEAGNASVNLTTLALSASGIASSPVITDIGGGWYRFSATFSPTVAGSHNLGFFSANTTGSVTVWGAMLAQSGLSSYYPSGATAGTRPHGYIDSWQSYQYDSGFVRCCPADAIKLCGWTDAQAASAYAYGGGACARHWLPSKKLAGGVAIDISDPDNLQGYVEAACLVAGEYWSPTYNASAARASSVDTTDLYRTDAGDQGADAGTVHKKITIDLSVLTAADRTAYASITRNSRAYPVLVSARTGIADLECERDHMVYGRRTRDAEIASTYAGMYSTTDEIEEI